MHKVVRKGGNMRFYVGFVGAFLRMVIAVSVGLGMLIQPVGVRAEATAPPSLKPILLRDIDTTGADSINAKCQYALGPLGPITLFVANDGVNGCALWKSDGSEAGTVRVKNISVMPIPGAVATLNNALYFTADDGEHGPALWRSDGSEAGTYRVAPVKPDREFVTLADSVYFFVDGGSWNWQLWRSDGTLSGTRMIWGFQFGSDAKPYSLVVMNGSLYFFMNPDGNGRHPLWTSNGTTDGTHLAVLLSGVVTSNLSVANNTLFFRMHLPSTSNESNVWRSNGTPEGTYAIRTTDGSRELRNPFAFTPFNGQMYFVAQIGTDSMSSLIRTDGTKIGTYAVLTITYTLPSFFIVAGSALYFPNYNEDKSGYELKRVNVMPTGEIHVVTIPPPNGNYSGYEGFGGYGAMTGLTDGRLVFGHSGGWWITDRTTAGTFALGSGQPFVTWANPQTNLVYAAIYDAAHGSELWKTNGTVAGTQLVKDINLASNNASLNQMTDVSGKLFFVASYEPNKPALWQSDGTVLGTQQVVTLSLPPQELTSLGNLLFYSDGYYSPRMWRTDGSPTGTLQITPQDVVAGGISCVSKACFTGPAQVTNAGRYVFFNAYGGGSGNRLWRSDGTLSGTVAVYNFQNNLYGTSAIHNRYLTAVNNSVFFLIQSPDTLAGRMARQLARGLSIRCSSRLRGRLLLGPPSSSFRMAPSICG
jgi:ELWxxDGT repeat protein